MTLSPCGMNRHHADLRRRLSTAFARLCLQRFGVGRPVIRGSVAFRAMVAVLLDAPWGALAGGPALAGLMTEGLLTPERLAEAEILEIADALPEAGATASVARL